MPHSDPIDARPGTAGPGGLPAVVLVHYGTPAFTARCLASLARTETEPHQAVVVDHGPGQGLEEALAGLHPRLRVLPSQGNPGFGAGCNRGAEAAFAAGAGAVWFLNNDATLERPTLGPLLAAARAHPQVALWGTPQRDGARLLGADVQARWFPATRAPSLGLAGGLVQLQGRETLSGASILVTREAWLRLGPWPEDHFLYLEDTAWCLRAGLQALPLALVDVPVLHPRSSTTGKRSATSIFYGVRNTFRLHRELYPAARAERLGMALDLLQKRFFQGRWGLLGHTFRGIRAGLAGGAGRDPRY